MGGLAVKMVQSMDFWANLGKNPYFESFLWPNHPFLGLTTFTKVNTLTKNEQHFFYKVFTEIEPIGFTEYGIAP